MAQTRWSSAESEAAAAGVLSAPLEYPPTDEEATPVCLRRPLVVIPQPNAVWTVEFMSDTLCGDGGLRTLTVLDEGVREGLAIEIDTSLPAEHLIRVLEQAVAWRDQPQAVRLELTSSWNATRAASSFSPPRETKRGPESTVTVDSLSTGVAGFHAT